MNSDLYSLRGLQDSLQSAPRRLLLICTLQILLLVIGVFVGHGSAECEVRLPQGSAIEVDCNRCRLLGGLRWRDVFILFCEFCLVLCRQEGGKDSLPPPF